MKLIPLSGKNGAGKFVKVDDEDYEKFGRLRWHLSAGRYAARKSGVTFKPRVFRSGSWVREFM